MGGEASPFQHACVEEENVSINHFITPNQTRMICGLHVTFPLCCYTVFFQVINKNGYICKKKKITKKSFFPFTLGWELVSINAPAFVALENKFSDVSGAFGVYVISALNSLITQQMGILLAETKLQQTKPDVLSM